MEVGDGYVPKTDICTACQCTTEGIKCRVYKCFLPECMKNEEAQCSPTVCCQCECVKKGGVKGNKPT